MSIKKITSSKIIIGLIAIFLLAGANKVSRNFIYPSIEISLTLSNKMDSLNYVQHHELVEGFRAMYYNVIDAGMRPKDLVVLKNTKEIFEAFQVVFQELSQLKKVSLCQQTDSCDLILQIDDVESFNLKYGALKGYVDSLDKDSNHQLLNQSLDLMVFNNAPKLLYASLIAIESNLLSIEHKLIEANARMVGACDLKFSLMPPNLLLLKVDSALQNYHTESYSQIYENPYVNTTIYPLSTFSVDVDKASYANVRRYIDNNILPPPDAVRIEELINYFMYDYPGPEGQRPLAIHTEYAKCPWNKEHNLLHIGLKAKDLTQELSFEDLPPNNLTFLIDVSGSMDSGDNKLPLLKSSFKQLIDKLRPKDRISIVVYAGAAGLVLPSTSGGHKQTIKNAIDKLSAGGPTAGGEGIALAYKVAKENYIKRGNNRIILATDGDFNVGPSSDADMLRLIEKNRDKGIYITCLGFGMGNYKDSKMEIIADHGNGNYAYIDSENEANYVLGTGFTGTLYTVAKDVKLQIEFNPNYVQAYRLIGYENRILLPEDYQNDQVDAGDMGSGHTVTAMYEIIPSGKKSENIQPVDKLKYQSVKPQKRSKSKEIATIKFRYKEPESRKSKELIQTVQNQMIPVPSSNFKFSTSVAEYGLLLRNSKFKHDASYDNLISRAISASSSLDSDQKNEFIQLATKANHLKPFWE